MITQYRLHQLINQNKISYEEIINFLNKDINEILVLMKDKSQSLRVKVLIKIYLDPACLYCKDMPETFIEELKNFIKNRYNMEKDEIDYRFSLGDMTQEEYDKSILLLEEYLFAGDNVISKNIKRIVEKENKIYKK